MSIQKKSTSHRNNLIRNKWVLWREAHPGRQETRETRTVSKGMYYKTGDDMDDRFGNFCCIMPRVHFISDPSYKYTEIGHVLDVNVICHHKVHGIDIQIASNNWRQPKFGWSYPEAEIVTWMSYDTENQNIFLKMLFNNLRKNKPSWKVRRPYSFPKKMDEAVSLTEIGSTSSGKEATKHYFSIARILRTD